MAYTTRKFLYGLNHDELKLLTQAIDLLEKTHMTIAGICQLDNESYISDGFDLDDLEGAIQNLSYIVDKEYSEITMGDEDI